MMLSVLVTILGIGALATMLFTFAVHALPAWIGFATGLWLHQVGYGVFAALIGGFVAGALTLALAEIIFANTRSTVLRIAFAMIYAIPAAVAGFHAARSLAEFSGASETGGIALAWLGAVVVGSAAWVRLRGEAGQTQGSRPDSTGVTDGTY